MLNAIRYTNFESLLSSYDAYVFDLWGVIHNGVTLYPGVKHCLEHLESCQKVFTFLSNAPRPATLITEKLTRLGLPAKTHMTLTSGDITRDFLSAFQGKVYHLGEKHNQDIAAGLTINFSRTLKDAQLILLTAFMDSEENLEQYDPILAEACGFNLPMICANPDKIAIHGSRTIYCPGFLAEKYEHMGGVVHYYGKPHLPIYEILFKRLENQGFLDKKRILMIGDSLETDIAGAKAAGIDSALVLTGNVNALMAKLKQTNTTQADFLTDLFKQKNLEPTWVLENLIINR